MDEGGGRPAVRVTVEVPGAAAVVLGVAAPFTIGRDPGCVVRVEHDQVSRRHAEVTCHDGRWAIQDLGSSNGTFLGGQRIRTAALPFTAVLQLGATGARLTLQLPMPAPARAPAAPDATRTPDPATVVGPERAPAASVQPEPPPPITVRVTGEPGGPRTLQFTDTVRIGRDPSCTLAVDYEGVSRAHAELYCAGRQWYVRDLGSSNGTYLDGAAVDNAPLPPRCILSFSDEGAQLEISYGEGASATATAPSAPAAVAPASPVRDASAIEDHYFGEGSEHPAGDRTMMIRQVYKRVKRTQARRYQKLIGVAAVLLIAAIGVGVFQYMELERTRALAVDLFYNMKTVELQLTRLAAIVAESGDSEQRQMVDSGRKQLREMESQYDAFLDELGVGDTKLDEVERLIFRMARVFGECELVIPQDFIDEVKRYIERWQANDRLPKGLQRAREQNLAPLIFRVMVSSYLPPQFFYLALQESEFKSRAIGPTTRFGIAKGMWQFMPATATQYGLSTGPLLELRQYDPADERFDAFAAGQAAARYLTDIYNGDAQASGLLVLASYNWGPTNIKRRIRTMPDNPRERNFWELLKHHEIPKETRDYVFLIFSAAVIGENPALFGFEFDNPLAGHDAS